MVVEYTKNGNKMLSAVGTVEYDEAESEMHITFVETHFGMYGIYIDEISKLEAENIMDKLKFHNYCNLSEKKLKIDFYDESEDNDF